MNIGTIESGNVIIKVLTTNDVSLTLLDNPDFRGKVIQPGAQANRASGEHGLSLAIKIQERDVSHLILMDVGFIGTIIENSKQFGINLNEIDKLIISHGHFDHFGALNQVIPLLKEGCEILIHPDAFLQFYGAILKSGEEVPAAELFDAIKARKDEFAVNRKMPPLTKNIIENLANQHKVKLIEIKGPIQLYNGIVTSGEIELADYDELTKGIYIMKSRKEFEKNTFRDETSLYINIKDQGLVVITGCGHCGIINTIKHGQKLTGVEKIYAVIGGFHEEWNPKEKIKQKAEYINSLKPEIACGMHCTGFEFNKYMSKYPSHALGVAGTEFRL